MENHVHVSVVVDLADVVVDYCEGGFCTSCKMTKK
jgi:hypothetical protein